MRRELAIVLRARATWLVASLAALLVGHGFVLALDVYASTSRSVLGSVLEAPGMDPLLGVVRPTLGGVSFSLALLGPILASRSLAIEKERNTYGALCLATGAYQRVVIGKWLASALGCALLLVPAILLLVCFGAVGGHVDWPEVVVALGGELLHLLVIASAAVAAAAWTRTLAQAITLALLLSLSAWAIDAADGFAALSWLGVASSWSIEQRLLPFGRGVVSIGSLLWLFAAAATFIGLALAGGSFAPRRLKWWWAAGVAVLGVSALLASGRIRQGFDWSEQRRASLPPPVVAGLRSLPEPITVVLRLDREDSRRKQLELDALAKLTLARPDISIVWPLDDDSQPLAGRRDADYGLITVQVGNASRFIRATGARELAALVFEAAGRPLPSWDQPPYAGFPFVPKVGHRQLLSVCAYAVLPLAMAALGLVLTQRRTAR